MILLASTCVATAHAADYAHFGATTDSIRILGNTTSATTAFTREMRIRVAPGSELGSVLSEQRDALEDKSTGIGTLEFYQSDVRGYVCGSETTSRLDATFAGGWHHVAYVRDGSIARLFIDGALRQEWTGLTTPRNALQQRVMHRWFAEQFASDSHRDSERVTLTIHTCPSC